MRTWKNLALAMGIATMAAGSARAELCNQYTPLTSVSVNTYTIVIVGDVRSQLNLTMTSSDAGVNPFAYAITNNFPGASGGTAQVTAALDANGNTVVTFTGTESNGITPITLNSSDIFAYGGGSAPHNGEPHIGIDGSAGSTTIGGGPPLNIISQGWSNTTTSFPLPALSVSVVNPPTSQPVNYAVFFAEVTASGNTTGQWFEVPYIAGTSPKLTLTDYTSSPETLSNVGYFLSPTYIPLDNLNYGTEPPPGVSGSTFAPLPNLDGSSLSGGDGIGGPGVPITTQSLPEPSSVISLGTGLLVAAGYFGRRRISTRLDRTAHAA